MNKQSPPTQPGLQEPISRQALKLLKHCLEKQHRKGDSVKTTHKSFIYNLTEQVIVTLLRCSHAGVGEASPKTPTDANSHHLEVMCKLGYGEQTRESTSLGEHMAPRTGRWVASRSSCRNRPFLNRSIPRPTDWVLAGIHQGHSLCCLPCWETESAGSLCCDPRVLVSCSFLFI